GGMNFRRARPFYSVKSAIRRIELGYATPRIETRGTAPRRSRREFAGILPRPPPRCARAAAPCRRGSNRALRRQFADAVRPLRGALRADARRPEIEAARRHAHRGVGG